MPSIICVDADFSAVAVDYFDPTLIPADLRDDLYALYLFGSSMPMPEGWDYSGNERHLTRFGTTAAGTLYQPVSQTDYYVPPFSGDDAIAAGTAGELTLFGITKASAGSVVLSSQDLALTRNIVGLNTISAGSASSARQYSGSGSTTVVGVASDSHRGTAPEFIASTHSAAAEKAYREYPTYALTSATGTPTGAPSTAGAALRIGALSGTGTGTMIGSANLTCAGVATRVLTSTELDTLYASLHDWLAAKSGTFWTT